MKNGVIAGLLLTVGSVTVTTESTAGTVTTNVCPTHGGSGMKKRHELDRLNERNPEPTSAPLEPEPHEKRQNPPNCLDRFGTQSAKLSSACSCFNYPVTSSTRTVRRTTTVKGVPTTTEYTDTVTLTTLVPSPTCAVVSTNKGKTVTWKEFYGVCKALRDIGNTPLDDGFVYPANLDRCTALNRCASDTMRVTVSTTNPFSNSASLIEPC